MILPETKVQNRFFPPKPSNRTSDSARAHLLYCLSLKQSSARRHEAPSRGSSCVTGVPPSPNFCARFHAPPHSWRVTKTWRLTWFSQVALLAVWPAPRSAAARGPTLPPCGRNRNYMGADTLKRIHLSIDYTWNREWLVLEHCSLGLIRSHSATFGRKYCNFTRTLTF